jgi:hypothetical protein
VVIYSLTLCYAAAAKKIADDIRCRVRVDRSSITITMTIDHPQEPCDIGVSASSTSSSSSSYEWSRSCCLLTPYRSCRELPGTGTGVPPSVLPTSITTCKLYQRTIGNLNFVVVSGSRGFRAEKIVNGRYFYEFQTWANGSLLIREEDCKTGDKLLLLEPSNLDVPVLLREQHSHWYSTNTGSVFLRGVSFSDRQITYVMSRKEMYFVPIALRATLTDKAFPVPPASSIVPDSRDSGFTFSCEEATWPGPQRYQATLVRDGEIIAVFQSISAMRPYRSMCHEELRFEDQFRVVKKAKHFVNNLEQFERLVQGETCAATFLHGFEANAFVHIYHDVACNSLRFDLPRLKLSFLLRDNVMSSIEFKGFSVVDQAAIRDTLPELNACVANVSTTTKMLANASKCTTNLSKMLAKCQQDCTNDRTEEQWDGRTMGRKIAACYRYDDVVVNTAECDGTKSRTGTTNP